MLNDNNLTQAQRNLHFKLKKVISNGGGISNILKVASENDLLKVLTIGYTTRFPSLLLPTNINGHKNKVLQH
ncbi:hypothetical protein [Wolbachia endosymbiont of Oryzaephilus surinamensis]|uniref:hypothetical protein n=1 Tax=Wolbachia endosymbiont of Oryzaephilus surinamensis TaxID=573241 RepID=UPI0021D52A69|nr:hypothetical protein [Wolbachia endosymbiont of Oryzaephilus surinamensis]UXX39985.1 hypothetical protein MJ631_05690 [Wolbachia endosymbiont of Oryzaephilus surinamensis]